MRTIALALCLALPAYADDAPRCLEPSERIALAQSLVAKDARIEALEASVKAAPSPVLVVVLVVAGVVVGGVAGYGVARAVGGAK